MHLSQLIRLRWAVRLTLFLGMTASIAANVLHAEHNIISQLISAWPPLALLITVELTSRIPMQRPLLATIRVLSTVVIAGIAAWVSYWHMQSVAARYGEHGLSSYLLPISVDGLIVVASVCLVELGHSIRKISEPEPSAPTVEVVATQPVAATPAPVAAVAAAPEAPVDADEEFEELERELAQPVSVGGSAHSPTRTPRSAPVSPAVAPAGTRAAVSTAPRAVVTESTAPRQRRPATETAQLADAIEAMQPGIREEELASRLNISVNRLRQIRREEAARRATLTGEHPLVTQ